MPGPLSLVTAALLKGRCQVCLTPVPAAAGPLCGNCDALLSLRQGGYCPRCGICYADASAPPYLCLNCRVSPPPWSALAFYAPYAGLLKELIHGYKFGHDHGLGFLLRHLAVRAWEAHGLHPPDRVVPVPMRSGKVLSRGFNQSVELARMLCSAFGFALCPDGLRKIRPTRPQFSLKRAARRENVAGAFAASSMKGLRVLLVDDVATTGATLSACARACLDAGASQVDVFVLARAL